MKQTTNKPWYERALSAGEKKRIKRLQKRVVRINALEEKYKALSDKELLGLADAFRERLDKGETLDDLLEDAFAAVRESSVRTLGMRHFDVQLMGGMVLHEGSIAEMKTGEGKTLVATLPLFLNGLTGNGVHLVTANDYLAKRDAQWMAPVYEALGMSVGFLQNMQPRDEKLTAYQADITYGTNSEFGFDYLRDNMAMNPEDLVQRSHSFAIVDEVDSILIDEARTPLIISGQPEIAAETYYQFANMMKFFVEGEDYEFDEKMHTAHPTEAGVSKAEKFLKIDNLYEAENNQLVNHLIQAIKAKSLYHKDKEYVVMDNEVKIVDEHTGRVMEGRRWSEGLHQAVEAKEGVAIQEESVTVATITIQNYFRLYQKLAGMTGTASTEAKEFKEIYDLNVVEVPPNKPVARLDHPDLIFKNEAGKFDAIVREIKERNQTGQPILIGTIAVEKSEKLSKALTKQGISHRVLNAKQHEMEAQIVMEAGQLGAVTIATNMAGRGVDIKLGPGVLDVGGLFVLGTERHESRRIDNQLRGRSGRQGDAGASRFFLSGEDDLVRVFAGDRIKGILERFALPDDQAIESSMLSKRIEGAQKKVEERNFVMRKNVLKYDDVLNRQRQVIYAQRREILDGLDIKENVLNWLLQEIEAAVHSYDEDHSLKEDGSDALLTAIKAIYPVRIDIEKYVLGDLDFDQLIEKLYEDATDLYEEREKEFSADAMRQLERFFLLRTIDRHWQEHLDNMDYLRDGIGLRSLAQINPIDAYRAEGYDMFEEMQLGVQSEVVSAMFRVEELPKDENRNERQFAYSNPEAALANSHIDEEQAIDPAPVVQRRVEEKVGRNSLCPCGSGKKYKHCHGR